MNEAQDPEELSRILLHTKSVRYFRIFFFVTSGDLPEWSRSRPEHFFDIAPGERFDRSDSLEECRRV